MNQWIHIVCVPLLVLTGLVLLARADISASLPPALVARVSAATGRPVDAGLPAALVYMAFYLYLTPSLLGLAAAALMAGAYVLAGQYGALTGLSWQHAAGAHVVCWLLQFYGHGVHEGRSPALLDNLAQALLMAPLFVLVEVVFKLGGLKAFHAGVAPEVARRIKAHREGVRSKARSE